MKVLFRPDEDTQEEYEIAKEILGDDCIKFASQLTTTPGEVVIGRYSVLPFYRYIEEEIALSKCRLINPYNEHKYIADMEWAKNPNIQTPRTWFNHGWANVPDTEHGWVVKGKTNSRKFKWNTHMYAKTRDDLKNVMERLMDDGFVADQGLVIREYIPLETFEIGINDMPITNEWRLFFINGICVGSGFYWSNAECANEMGNIPTEALSLAYETLRECQVPALVIDVGKTENEGWVLIEINDFQMSGLSCVDPENFYTNLKMLSEDFIK